MKKVQAFTPPAGLRAYHLSLNAAPRAGGREYAYSDRFKTHRYNKSRVKILKAISLLRFFYMAIYYPRVN